MPERTNQLTHSPARIESWLFALAAAGEIAVGLAVLAFPGPVMELLLAETIVGIGLIVARMFGLAIIALGMTWWLTRSDLHRQLKRMAPGFIIYNLGVGIVFLLYALLATRPVPFSWAVALLHLLVGVAFSAAVVIGHRPATPGEAVPPLRAA
jgi:hypothetical protein